MKMGASKNNDIVSIFLENLARRMFSHDLTWRFLQRFYSFAFPTRSFSRIPGLVWIGIEIKVLLPKRIDAGFSVGYDFSDTFSVVGHIFSWSTLQKSACHDNYSSVRCILRNNVRFRISFSVYNCQLKFLFHGKKTKAERGKFKLHFTSIMLFSILESRMENDSC